MTTPLAQRRAPSLRCEQLEDRAVPAVIIGVNTLDPSSPTIWLTTNNSAEYREFRILDREGLIEWINTRNTEQGGPTFTDLWMGRSFDGRFNQLIELGDFVTPPPELTAPLDMSDRQWIPLGDGSSGLYYALPDPKLDGALVYDRSICIYEVQTPLALPDPAPSNPTPPPTPTDAPPSEEPVADTPRTVRTITRLPSGETTYSEEPYPEPAVRIGRLGKKIVYGFTDPYTVYREYEVLHPRGLKKWVNAKLAENGLKRGYVDITDIWLGNTPDAKFNRVIRLGDFVLRNSRPTVAPITQGPSAAPTASDPATVVETPPATPVEGTTSPLLPVGRPSPAVPPSVLEDARNFLEWCIPPDYFVEIAGVYFPHWNIENYEAWFARWSSMGDPITEELIFELGDPVQLDGRDVPVYHAVNDEAWVEHWESTLNRSFPYALAQFSPENWGNEPAPSTPNAVLIASEPAPVEEGAGIDVGLWCGTPPFVPEDDGVSNRLTILNEPALPPATTTNAAPAVLPESEVEPVQLPVVESEGIPSPIGGTLATVLPYYFLATPPYYYGSYNPILPEMMDRISVCAGC